jgi:hypothetical protein
MRTQEQNPAYQRYAHLLTPNGRYPVRDADIFWNLDANQKITDVEVVFIPRHLIKGDPARFLEPIQNLPHEMEL